MVDIYTNNYIYIPCSIAKYSNEYKFVIDGTEYNVTDLLPLDDNYYKFFFAPGNLDHYGEYEYVLRNTNFETVASGVARKVCKEESHTVVYNVDTVVFDASNAGYNDITIITD